MKQRIEDIRAKLSEGADFAEALLHSLLEPISYQYRQNVLRSFDAEFRALPYALQEEAPDEASSTDFLNISVTIALMNYYRSVIVPLDGARRFSRTLKNEFDIAEIQLGQVVFDQASRTATKTIVDGFNYMAFSMGIPVPVVQAGNSREAIRMYFSEEVATGDGDDTEE